MLHSAAKSNSFRYPFRERFQVCKSLLPPKFSKLDSRCDVLPLDCQNTPSLLEGALAGLGTEAHSIYARISFFHGFTGPKALQLNRARLLASSDAGQSPAPQPMSSPPCKLYQYHDQKYGGQILSVTSEKHVLTCSSQHKQVTSEGGTEWRASS